MNCYRNIHFTSPRLYMGVIKAILHWFKKKKNDNSKVSVTCLKKCPTILKSLITRSLSPPFRVISRINTLGELWLKHHCLIKITSKNYVLLKNNIPREVSWIRFVSSSTNMLNLITFNSCEYGWVILVEHWLLWGAKY